MTLRESKKSEGSRTRNGTTSAVETRPVFSVSRRKLKVALSSAVLVAGLVAAFWFDYQLPAGSHEAKRTEVAQNPSPREESTRQSEENFRGHGLASTPQVSDAQWVRLVSPLHSDRSFDSIPLQTEEEHSSNRSPHLATSRLPHLRSMLEYRLQGVHKSVWATLFNTSSDEKKRRDEDMANSENSLIAKLLSELGGELEGSADATASRLSAVLEVLEALLKVYEDNEMEDAEKITAHHGWPVSVSSGEGEAEEAEGVELFSGRDRSKKVLPHDVMLLGEWASALSKALRVKLFIRGGDYGTLPAMIDGGDENDAIKTESIAPLHLSQRGAVSASRQQQLLTLCVADADVLPQYFLVTEDTSRHAESLMAGVECLRTLRNSVAGAVIFEETHESRTSSESAALQLRGKLSTHGELEKRLSLLISDTKMTKARIVNVLESFARKQLCVLNITTASPSQEEAIADVNQKQKSLLAEAAESLCLKRFSSLAFPAGLNTKIGSLLEEAIAMDSLFPPFRVMYLAHLTLGMGRCEVEVQSTIEKELAHKRISAAPTPFYARWLKGLLSACRRRGNAGEEREASVARSFAGLEPERLKELMTIYPQSATMEVAEAFSSKGLSSSLDGQSPIRIIGDAEYRLFLSLADQL